MIVYYLLVWTLPLMEHPIWAHKIGPLSVFEYMGMICFSYSVVHVLSRNPFPSFLSTWETRFLLVLYLIAFFSAMTKGGGLSLSNSSLIIYTSSLFLILITFSVVDTLRRLRWTVLTLIGSYGFASLYVIREWQKGHLIYANFRPGWIVGDSNYFSTTAIFAIFLAFYFIHGKRPRWEKAYCLICLLLTILAVTFCASRGAFLGLVAAALFLVWHTKRRVRNLLISALVLPLSLALPMSALHRFLDPTTDYGSTQFHLEAWKAGLHMIEAHPIAGIGLGNFKPLMPSYMTPGTNVDVDTVAHNMFIEVAAELGLPALVIFLAMFWFTYRTLGKLRRSSPTHPLIRETAAALQAGLVGFAMAGSFVSALMFCLLPLVKSQKLMKQVHREMPIAAVEEDFATHAFNG
jgi:O-antigen ligase